MSQTVFGAPAVVTMLNRAFMNGSPGNAVFNNQVAAAGTTEASQTAFALQFGNSFAGLSDAALSTLVLGYLGVLPNAELETAVAQYFADNGLANRGLVVLQLGQILSTLETAPAPQNIFNAAAIAWNKEVERGFLYSSDVDNSIPQTGDFDTMAVTLSRETDVATSAVFNGYLDYNKFTGNDEQTLTTADRLTGTAGDSDVLFAQLTTLGQRPTLSGIEIISIDAKAAAVGLDLSDTTGAKTLVNKGSVETAALTFANVKNLVDVRVEATNANTTVNFIATAVAGTADNVNVMLNGVGVPTDRPDVTLGGGNIESLTISTMGAASQLTNIASAGTKTVTVTGDQALRATLTAATIATLDASAATGALNLNVAAAGAEDQTITLGSANDNVTVAGLTAKDTITGGEGTDRVTLADAGTNEATKMVGVEQIGVTTNATNINLVNAADVNLIAVAEVAGGITVQNVTAAKSGLTFAFEGEGTVAAPADGINAVFGNVKYNLANATGKSDVINFTFNNKGVAMAKDATVTIGTLNNSGNNVETLNFTFSDLIASNTVTIADIEAGAETALNTLNFTSDSKVVVNGVADLKAVTKVDATGVKAGFVATFGSGVAGELGANADTNILLGGAGKNNVLVTGAESTAGTAAVVTNKVLTLDGSAGTGQQTLALVNNDVNTTLAAVNGYSAVVRGGMGGDTITVTSIAGAGVLVAAGGGIDTINLGGSVAMDLVQLSLGDTGSTVASADTVNGFNAALDKLDLRNFGFDVGLQGVDNNGTVALDGTAGEFGGLAVSKAVVGGNTQVYVDTNGDNRLSDGDLVTVLNLVGAGFDNADVVWF